MNQNFLLKLFCVPLVFLIAGCNTISYQEPATGELARVRFVTDSPATTMLWHYDNSSCSVNEQEWMRLFTHDLAIRKSPKRLGIPGWNYPESAGKEVYVDASKDHTFLFKSEITLVNESTLYSCGVPLTINFESGKDYEVYFKFGPNYKICSVDVSEVVGTSDVVFVPLKTYTNRVEKENEGCLEQFKKGRWS
jgi:hypothetical protein